MAVAPYINGNLWKDSSQFLNWPGVQYLFYTKIKPFYASIDSSILRIRNRLDDENFYISYIDASTIYDASDGIVYMNYQDDNTILAVDASGNHGTIDNDGMLKMFVNTQSHIAENGSYIDGISLVPGDSSAHTSYYKIWFGFADHYNKVIDTLSFQYAINNAQNRAFRALNSTGTSNPFYLCVPISLVQPQVFVIQGNNGTVVPTSTMYDDIEPITVNNTTYRIYYSTNFDANSDVTLITSMGYIERYPELDSVEDFVEIGTGTGLLYVAIV